MEAAPELSSVHVPSPGLETVADWVRPTRTALTHELQFVGFVFKVPLKRNRRKTGIHDSCFRKTTWKDDSRPHWQHAAGAA